MALKGHKLVDTGWRYYFYLIVKKTYFKRL